MRVTYVGATKSSFYPVVAILVEALLTELTLGGCANSRPDGLDVRKATGPHRRTDAAISGAR